MSSLYTRPLAQVVVGDINAYTSYYFEPQLNISGIFIFKTKIKGQQDQIRPNALHEGLVGHYKKRHISGKRIFSQVGYDVD